MGYSLLSFKIRLVKQSGLFGMTKQKNWKSFWDVEYEDSPYVWDNEDHSNPISKVQVRFDGSRGLMRQGDTLFS
jgi:hypothetical protein